jgi:anti-anti-sigma factor
MSMVAEAKKKVDTLVMSPSGTGQPEETLNISLVSIEKEGLVRLASSGSITAASFDPNGRNPLERILGPNWASMRVMIDFSRTSYIDSSAIGWLIATNKAFREANGRLALHDVPPNVRQLLDMLQVGRVITIAPGANEAREYVLGGQAS